MDVEQLAGSAVGLIVPYLKRMTESLGGHVSDSIAERLYQLVERRLDGDDFGRAALIRLRERPDDERRAQALETAVLDAAEEDSHFRAALAEVVQQQSGPSDRPAVGQAGVAIGKMRRSQFSVGPMTITNTRRLHVSLGAGAIAVAGILILLFSLLSANNDGPGSPGPGQRSPAQPTGSGGAESQEGRLDQLPAGPAVQFSDKKGYRFTVAGVRKVVTVQLNPELAAAPGTVFSYVDIRLTNKQKDRTAPLTDHFGNWYILVPKNQFQDQDWPLCDYLLVGYCGDHVSCLRIDEFGRQVSELDSFAEEESIMPAGAVWWLRCILGSSNFGNVSGADAVKDSVKSSEIRFLRLVDDGGSVKSKQEFRFA